MYTVVKKKIDDGVGAPNGPGVVPFDRWFRYPAGFSVNALNACFYAANATQGKLVVDPFAGVSTTGTKAISLGLRFTGIEAHPLVAELSSLKFRRPASPEQLIERAKSLVAEQRISAPQAEHDLVKRSFEGSTLAKLLGLRDRIRELDADPWQLHLKWSLLGALRDCASVNVGWPYQRPNISRVPRIVDPYRAFVRRATWMAEDLGVSGPASTMASVFTGDARDAKTWTHALGQCLADAIITSPPYLNNFDYADATRLELYFWGEVSSWKQMTSFARSGMVIASTQQSKKQLAYEAAAMLTANCPESAGRIRVLTEALHREYEKRPRGKEYQQVLPSYFADLAQVLINIREHTSPQAPIVLVLGDSAPYGVYVDTPDLLASIGQELGFTRRSTQILRRRGLRWHTNGTRHNVALSEKLVVLSPTTF
jgi:hypothetical protein